MLSFQSVVKKSHLCVSNLRVLSAVYVVERLRVCVYLSVSLTEAAELANDGRERVVHHTLQLTADALGQLPSAEVTRLDVPLHQRHGEASHRHELQGNTRKKHTPNETQMQLVSI